MASSWGIGQRGHGAGGRNVVLADGLVIAVNFFTVTGLIVLLKTGLSLANWGNSAGLGVEPQSG